MLGREPDKAVRDRIEVLRVSLGARDDDAIWVVIGVFESAIDRLQRAFKIYVWCLIAVGCIVLLAQSTSLLLTLRSMKSFGPMMRAEIATSMHQGLCGGTEGVDACEIARINAGSSAKQIVSAVIARMPENQATALAALPNLDLWLDYTIKVAAQVAASQNSIETKKQGKTGNGR